MASKEPGSAHCKLDASQLHVLQTMLDAGPAAAGWSDQCWTLARIAEVVHRRFRVEYTLAGLDLLLHRIDWSVQVPSRKATERDEEKSATSKRSLTNLTKHSLDQLTALVKTRLRRMQYRPSLIDGLTAKTGLDFQPP
ncbi:winged helix-turn-helix domain-containing protein [Streptomyces sp. NPDC057696]|uniref:helix-turn-helix domain-containing protein n=1 Tax=unclassified Streptomyces TaxID=2593676 RepID=UPI0036761160